MFYVYMGNILLLKMYRAGTFVHAALTDQGDLSPCMQSLSGSYSDIN